MTRCLVISIIAPLTISFNAFADTAILYPTDDSYVMEIQPSDNFGSDVIMLSGWWSGGELRPALLFDLSSYSGETINSATLMMYIGLSGPGLPPDDNWIGRLTGTWDESTITWYNQPVFQDWYYTVNIPAVGEWWDVDITAWTAAWTDGSYDNYGVVLGADGGYPGEYAGIRTKEFSGTEYDPYIDLDYGSISVKSASIGEIKAAFK